MVSIEHKMVYRSSRRSDPHPGNVFVRSTEKSGGSFEIVLLDHGLYRELDKAFRLDYAKIWLALLSGNEEEIRVCSERLGGRSERRAHHYFTHTLIHMI